MPVPQSSGVAAKAEIPAPQAQSPQSVHVHLQTTTSPMTGAAAFSQVPPIPVAQALPPGWKIVRDEMPGSPLNAGMPSEAGVATQANGPPVAPLIPAQNIATVPPANDKLVQCEQKMAEMTERLTGLQNTTEITQQAMLSMAAEQMRLQKENELLKQRADETHKEFIQSIDSISELIEEVLPSEPPTQKPVPRQSTKRTVRTQEQTAVLLPSVDEQR